MIIHKRIKELSKFVAADQSRPSLQHVAVISNNAVATDGAVLVIMPLSNDHDDGDYPAAPAPLTTALPETVLLTPARLDQAVKNLPKKPDLPILNSIQLAESDGKPVINSGLPPVQFPACDGEPYDSYPNYKVVLPDNTDHNPMRMAFNARYLKQICELAIRHGNNENRIIFEIPTTKQAPVIDGDGNVVFNGDDLQVHEAQPSRYRVTTARRYSTVFSCR